MMLVILKKIGTNYDEADQKLISIWDIVWFVIFWDCSTLYLSVRNRETLNEEIKKSKNQKMKNLEERGIKEQGPFLGFSTWGQWGRNLVLGPTQ